MKINKIMICFALVLFLCNTVTVSSSEDFGDILSIPNVVAIDKSSSPVKIRIKADPAENPHDEMVSCLTKLPIIIGTKGFQNLKDNVDLICYSDTFSEVIRIESFKSVFDFSSKYLSSKTSPEYFDDFCEMYLTLFGAHDYNERFHHDSMGKPDNTGEYTIYRFPETWDNSNYWALSYFQNSTAMNMGNEELSVRIIIEDDSLESANKLADSFKAATDALISMSQYCPDTMPYETIRFYIKTEDDSILDITTNILGQIEYYTCYSENTDFSDAFISRANLDLPANAN